MQATGAVAPAERPRSMKGVVLALLAILVALGVGGAWYVFGGTAPTTSPTTVTSTSAATSTGSAGQSSVGASPVASPSAVPTSTPTPATSPTPTPTPSSASPSSTPSTPAGATVCATSDTAYGRAGTGSSATSCGFATAVRTAYLAAVAQPGGSATVTAASPVTGKSYTMTCTGGSVVRCTGGNDAVVYIW